MRTILKSLPHIKYLVATLLLAVFCENTIAQGPIDATYNNVTARFNAYFYAKQRIFTVEEALNQSFEWNYNKILPIYAQYDTTFSNSQEVELEDCIKKASISIQRHPGSKWEYDCYILVGKARLYGSEFPEAVETFKYVNTKSDNKNERYAALVELLRTFVEAHEYQNAESVADFLGREKLTGENLKNLYLNKAYLYQKKKDLDKTVQNLVLAEALLGHGREKARINFIIGQIYQQLGFEAAAYKYYRNTLKNSPEYELSFYTKLNIAQVTELRRGSDKKKIKKYFKKLLKDPKNIEYKDKIYYELGAFELKQGNIEEAIAQYKLSISNSTKNNRQKAYSYLKLSEIYYDSLGNYPLAKLYYDSTAQTMPSDEDNYVAIKERQEILIEFIKHYNIIQENDSLLGLSMLSQTEQQELVAEIVDNRARALEESEKEKKKRERRARNRSINLGDGLGTEISTTTEGVWYFYNISSVSRGRSEFQRNWGQRTLEDNWRRRNKSNTNLPGIEIADEAILNKRPEEDDGPVYNKEAEMSRMLAAIPQSDEEKHLMLAEIEEAYYQLGFIYNFQLEEKENAIETFELLIARFDTSRYKAEVLYQLYLLYKPIDPSQADTKAQMLLAQFPDSVYSKLIFNPRYREENLAKNKRIQEIYAKAYDAYKAGAHEHSVSIIDSVLRVYPESDYHDHLELLKILNNGKTENIYQYQYELDNFMKTHSNSELGSYADELLTASREHQINLYSSSRGRYIKSFDQSHYFLVVYESSGSLSSSILGEVDEFASSTNMTLGTGNLVLDDEYSMVLANDFEGKNSAKSFLQQFNKERNLESKYKGENFYVLVITRDNFEILYDTKDLRSYLNFFDKNY